MTQTTILKLPEGDKQEFIEAQAGEISVSTSHKQLIQTCQLCRLEANGQDPRENCSFHS